MCEATLPDELNTFYAHFDLLNKESAVKFTPPPEDSVSIHRGCEKSLAVSVIRVKLQGLITSQAVH